jgi:hypothetical protein
MLEATEKALEEAQSSANSNEERWEKEKSDMDIRDANIR